VAGSLRLHRCAGHSGPSHQLVQRVRSGELVEPRSRGFGFGYDPVFWVPEAGQTFAEMEPAEKHRWSHRAAAVRALIASGELAALASGTWPE
jgi:inosine/xanthosine triphosphate pyrophosphatase family protein